MRIASATLATVLAALVAVPAAQGKSAKEIQDYWTTERMQSAKPKEKAKPGGGGGGGGSGATSVEVTSITGALTAHGKVFFTDSGVNYVCSGTAVSGNVIWTAGHCVHDGGDASAPFYTNFMFVPAYRDGAAPLGRFAVPSKLFTTSGWRSGGEFGVDSGAAVPGLSDKGQTLDQAVTVRSIAFNTAYQQSYDVYGYPAARKFNGQRLRVCNTAWSRTDTSTNPDAIGVPCDMTGGSSGGGFVDAAGRVVSNVSYGYGSLKNVLFGPHLETEAQQLYQAADAAG